MTTRTSIPHEDTAPIDRSVGPPRVEPIAAIVVDLSPEQVAQIVRSAADAIAISPFLSGLGNLGADQALAVRRLPEMDNPRLSRSLLSGLLVLASFPVDGGSRTYRELGELAGTPADSTYRYVKTLVAVGLVQRLSKKEGFRLAPFDSRTPATSWDLKTATPARQDRSVMPKRLALELSQAQVDRIVSEVSGAAGVSETIKAGRAAVLQAFHAEPQKLHDPGLVRSLMRGLLFLVRLPSDGSYLSHSQAARLAEMSPTTFTRYLSTLLVAGLLDRHPSTRRYRLKP
jgi:hypothetical protein